MYTSPVTILDVDYHLDAFPWDNKSRGRNVRMAVMRTEQNQPLVKILHSMWADLRVAWFWTVKEFHV